MYCSMKLVAKKEIEKKDKAWRVEAKGIREKLKTHKDWLNDLQVVFNTFIRERDKHDKCISCGCTMIGRKGDASHYYSVGSSPSLRVDEDNCHLACVPCNQHKGGNLIEYGLRLPLKIGQARFDALRVKKQLTIHLIIPEIKELIKIYKFKIMQLKSN